MLKSLSIAAGLCVAAIIVYDLIVLATALYRGKAVAEASRAFAAPVEDPGNTRSIVRVLVAGDSTAVGTGTKDPRLSVAGRLHGAYPEVSIENLAVNGAVTTDVIAQLSAASRERYHVVLIQVGGNDVMKFTGQKVLGQAAAEMLDQALSLGSDVVLLTMGDVGAAPAIPWPLTRVLSARSKMVRTTFKGASETRGISYVSMYTPEVKENPFQQNPERYYAADGLHPSGEGYGVWYQHLLDSSPIHSWLKAD